MPEIPKLPSLFQYWSQKLRSFNRRNKEEKPTEQFNGLWMKRPQQIQQAINLLWSNEDHSKPPPKTYIFEGEYGKYTFGEASSIESSTIIASLIKEGHQKPIQCLDIGTALGGFLLATQKQFGRDVSLHGISAHEYRQKTHDLDGFDYKIADAENLLKTYPANSVDLIVSKSTILHFIDPLGAIAQMYEALKPDGILALDRFYIPGIENSFPAIIAYLNTQGYRIAAEYSYDIKGEQMKPTACKTLIIRKTHPHFKLPIEYITPSDAKQSKAEYSLLNNIDLPLLSFPLPEKLIAAKNKLFQLYPNTKPEDRDRLFQTFTLRNLPFNGGTTYILSCILSDWDNQIKNMDPQKRAVAHEIRQLLAEGVPAWINQYRNKESFILELALLMPKLLL